MTKSIDLRPVIGVKIQNDSGEDIPPRSVVVITTVEITPQTDDNPSEAVHHVMKYTGQTGNILVTGPDTIPAASGSGTTEASGWSAANSYGRAYADMRLSVSINPNIARPTKGEQWGPTAGQWYISRGGKGFLCDGYPATGTQNRATFMRLAVSSGSSELKHAIPRECVGDGYWIMELADFYVKLPETASDGSSGSSDTTDPCDDCHRDYTEVPDDDTGGTLIGNGEIVVAKDYNKIRLLIPFNSTGPTNYAGCVISKVDGTHDENSASGSGSASSSSGESEIYFVLTGKRPVVKVPVEEWDCCGGVEKLIRSYKVLVEAEKCDEVFDPCS